MTTWMLIFGILTVATACGVVFSPKSLNSALFLVLTFFLIAAHYALIGADFIAVLQVLVYAGAIMVLVIFVIMLLGLKEEGEKKRFDVTAIGSFVVCASFAVLLFYMARHPEHFPPNLNQSAPQVSGSPEAVGERLFTKYLYPFEIVSLLLLGAIVGAVVLVYDPKRPLSKGRGLKAKQVEAKQ